jgi:putative DNA primase/helicase
MNIGILTGSETGVFVVDIDPRHHGDVSLNQLQFEHGALPKTLTAATGGGGIHYLFKIPPGVSVKNSAGKLGPGIDIRGDGGLIVVEPSRTTGDYKWK